VLAFLRDNRARLLASGPCVSPPEAKPAAQRESVA